VRGFLARVELAARDHDVGPGCGEREQHLAAEPAAAGGDEGDLPGQVEPVRRADGRAPGHQASTEPDRDASAITSA
jgi:hypothetical protein